MLLGCKKWFLMKNESMTSTFSFINWLKRYHGKVWFTRIHLNIPFITNIILRDSWSSCTIRGSAGIQKTSLKYTCKDTTEFSDLNFYLFFQDLNFKNLHWELHHFVLPPPAVSPWELKIIFLKTQTMISSADTKCIIPIGQTQHLTMRDSGMKKAESLP